MVKFKDLLSEGNKFSSADDSVITPIEKTESPYEEYVTPIENFGAPLELDNYTKAVIAHHGQVEAFKEAVYMKRLLESLNDEKDNNQTDTNPDDFIINRNKIGDGGEYNLSNLLGKYVSLGNSPYDGVIVQVKPNGQIKIKKEYNVMNTWNNDNIAKQMADAYLQDVIIKNEGNLSGLQGFLYSQDPDYIYRVAQTLNERYFGDDKIKELAKKKEQLLLKEKELKQKEGTEEQIESLQNAIENIDETIKVLMSKSTEGKMASSLINSARFSNLITQTDKIITDGYDNYLKEKGVVVDVEGYTKSAKQNEEALLNQYYQEKAAEIAINFAEINQEKKDILKEVTAEDVRSTIQKLQSDNNDFTEKEKEILPFLGGSLQAIEALGEIARDKAISQNTKAISDYLGWSNRNKTLQRGISEDGIMYLIDPEVSFSKNGKNYGASYWQDELKEEEHKTYSGIAIGGTFSDKRDHWTESLVRGVGQGLVTANKVAAFVIPGVNNFLHQTGYFNTLDKLSPVSSELAEKSIYNTDPYEAKWNFSADKLANVTGNFAVDLATSFGVGSVVKTGLIQSAKLLSKYAASSGIKGYASRKGAEALANLAIKEVSVLKRVPVIGKYAGRLSFPTIIGGGIIDGQEVWQEGMNKEVNSFSNLLNTTAAIIAVGTLENIIDTEGLGRSILGKKLSMTDIPTESKKALTVKERFGNLKNKYFSPSKIEKTPDVEVKETRDVFEATVHNTLTVDVAQIQHAKAKGIDKNRLFSETKVENGVAQSKVYRLDPQDEALAVKVPEEEMSLKVFNKLANGNNHFIQNGKLYRLNNEKEIEKIALKEVNEFGLTAAEVGEAYKSASEIAKNKFKKFGLLAPTFKVGDKIINNNISRFIISNGVEGFTEILQDLTTNGIKSTSNAVSNLFKLPVVSEAETEDLYMKVSNKTELTENEKRRLFITGRYDTGLTTEELVEAGVVGALMGGGANITHKTKEILTGQNAEKEFLKREREYKEALAVNYGLDLKKEEDRQKLDNIYANSFNLARMVHLGLEEDYLYKLRKLYKQGYISASQYMEQKNFISEYKTKNFLYGDAFNDAWNKINYEVNSGVAPDIAKAIYMEKLRLKDNLMAKRNKLNRILSFTQPQDKNISDFALDMAYEISKTERDKMTYEQIQNAYNTAIDNLDAKMKVETDDFVAKRNTERNNAIININNSFDRAISAINTKTKITDEEKEQERQVVEELRKQAFEEFNQLQVAIQNAANNAKNDSDKGLPLTTSNPLAENPEFGKDAFFSAGEFEVTNEQISTFVPVYGASNIRTNVQKEKEDGEGYYTLAEYFTTLHKQKGEEAKNIQVGKLHQKIAKIQKEVIDAASEAIPNQSKLKEIQDKTSALKKEVEGIYSQISSDASTSQYQMIAKASISQLATLERLLNTDNISDNTNAQPNNIVIQKQNNNKKIKARLSAIAKYQNVIFNNDGIRISRDKKPSAKTEREWYAQPHVPNRMFKFITEKLRPITEETATIASWKRDAYFAYVSFLMAKTIEKKYQQIQKTANNQVTLDSETEIFRQIEAETQEIYNSFLDYLKELYEIRKSYLEKKKRADTKAESALDEIIKEYNEFIEPIKAIKEEIDKEIKETDKFLKRGYHKIVKEIDAAIQASSVDELKNISLSYLKDKEHYKETAKLGLAKFMRYFFYQRNVKNLQKILNTSVLETGKYFSDSYIPLAQHQNFMVSIKSLMELSPNEKEALTKRIIEEYETKELDTLTNHFSELLTLIQKLDDEGKLGTLISQLKKEEKTATIPNTNPPQTYTQTVYVKEAGTLQEGFGVNIIEQIKILANPKETLENKKKALDILFNAEEYGLRRGFLFEVINHFHTIPLFGKDNNDYDKLRTIYDLGIKTKVFLDALSVKGFSQFLSDLMVADAKLLKEGRYDNAIKETIDNVALTISYGERSKRESDPHVNFENIMGFLRDKLLFITDDFTVAVDKANNKTFEKETNNVISKIREWQNKQITNPNTEKSSSISTIAEERADMFSLLNAISALYGERLPSEDDLNLIAKAILMQGSDGTTYESLLNEININDIDEIKKVLSELTLLLDTGENRAYNLLSSQKQIKDIINNLDKELDRLKVKVSNISIMKHNQSVLETKDAISALLNGINSEDLDDAKRQRITEILNSADFYEKDTHQGVVYYKINPKAVNEIFNILSKVNGMQSYFQHEQDYMSKSVSVANSPNKQEPFPYSLSQRINAFYIVYNLLKGRTNYIAGLGGTGKTTSLKLAIEVFAKMNTSTGQSLHTHFMTPNEALLQNEAYTNYSESVTATRENVSRDLTKEGYVAYFDNVNKANPTDPANPTPLADTKIIVIDEANLFNNNLGEAIFDFTEKNRNVKFILVSDISQLKHTSHYDLTTGVATIKYPETHIPNPSNVIWRNANYGLSKAINVLIPKTNVLPYENRETSSARRITVENKNKEELIKDLSKNLFISEDGDFGSTVVEEDKFFEELNREMNKRPEDATFLVLTTTKEEAEELRKKHSNISNIIYAIEDVQGTEADVVYYYTEALSDAQNHPFFHSALYTATTRAKQKIVYSNHIFKGVKDLHVNTFSTANGVKQDMSFARDQNVNLIKQTSKGKGGTILVKPSQVVNYSKGLETTNPETQNKMSTIANKAVNIKQTAGSSESKAEKERKSSRTVTHSFSSNVDAITKKETAKTNAYDIFSSGYSIINSNDIAEIC